MGFAISVLLDALQLAQTERLAVQVVGVLAHMVPALAHGLSADTEPVGMIRGQPVEGYGHQEEPAVLLQMLPVPAACPARATGQPLIQSSADTPMDATCRLLENLLRGRTVPREQLLQLQAEVARGRPYQPVMLQRQLAPQPQAVQQALLQLLTGSGTLPVPRLPAPHGAAEEECFFSRPSLETDHLARSSLDLWEFSAFDLVDTLGEDALQQTVLDLLAREGLLTSLLLDFDKLARFLRRLERGYRRSNPYHNHIHAVAVVQATHMLLKHGGVGTFLRAQAPATADALCLAAYLAAALHDYEHPGLNNAFLSAALDKRAVYHNDQLPNENHHLAAAFQLLLEADCNFLGDAHSSTFVLVRRTVIDMVLHTDMQRHFEMVAAFRSCLLGSSLDVQTVLRYVLKCADLGHTTSPRHAHLLWVTRLEEECFRQGDREKALGMPVSALMDREGGGISKAQCSFFEIIVLPLYAHLLEAFPRAFRLAQNAKLNYEYWATRQTNSV